MRAEEKNMVERIMNTETMGYAYEYPYGGGARKEYMLALTPENLANFIGARGYDAKKIVITDVLDRLIVNTCMGRTIMIGILIVAAVGIIGFLLTAGIAFGIAGSYQID